MTRHHQHLEDDPVVRPFADWLREQSSGKSHDELGDALHQLIARVKDTGKKGTLTYTVTVEPMKESERILVVADNIALKLPEFPRQASVFYTDADGNLVRNDPNQLSFDSLREVPAPTIATGAPAGVDPSTGEVTDPAALSRAQNGA